MSIFGNLESFAIESEIAQTIDSQIYIHFRFHINGEPIGNFEDEIQLSTCLSYLQEFLAFSGQRYEEELDGKDKDEVFESLYDSIFISLPSNFNIKDITSNVPFFDIENALPYHNLRERFHLDAVGLSSVQDIYSILLLETASNNERLLWKKISDKEVIHEYFLPADTFELLAQQFQEWAKQLTQNTLNSDE